MYNHLLNFHLRDFINFHVSQVAEYSDHDIIDNTLNELIHRKPLSL